MRTREELWSFFRDETELTPLQLAGKNSSLNRGLPYYGKLRKEYPDHWTSFASMHHRSCKTSNEFPRDTGGFIEFLLYLGDVPMDMVQPTIGRKDHSLGYFRGNFEWQSRHDNQKERLQRCGYSELTRYHFEKYKYTQRNKLGEFLDSLERPFIFNRRNFHITGYKSLTFMMRSAKALGFEFYPMGKHDYVLTKETRSKDDSPQV